MLSSLVRLLVAALVLASAVAFAQSIDLPACNMQLKTRQFERTRTPPDFRGCPVDEARLVLKRFDYQTNEPPDEAVTGIASGIITAQSVEGHTATLVVATGAGYPPPAPEPVRFSLSASREVAEGSTFTLTIERDRNDGQSHQLALTYNPAGLLTDPPGTFIFSGADPRATIPLQSAPGSPDDGDKTMTIAIIRTDEGATVGKSPRISVKIADSHAPQSYTIATSGDVRRDAPITFVVTRSDVTDPVNPTFDVSQDGKSLVSTRPAQFGDGEATWSRQVGPDLFTECGGPVAFNLHAAGQIKPWPATFTGPLPAVCSTPTGDGGGGGGSTDPGLDWPKIAVGIVLILLTGYGLHKWPWIKPKITARWSIARPLVSPFTLGQAALRWPGASAQVRIDPGDTHLPDPLPVEDDDHG